MAEIVIYTTPWCPYCARAKKLLDSKGLAYQEIDVDANPARRAEMTERSGRSTVPQIFIDGRSVGGCDDIHALEASGRLNPMLGL